MSIPPELPFPHIQKSAKYAGQVQERTVTLGGNVNALAASLCLIALAWTLPRSLHEQWYFWPQVILNVFVFYCAIAYGKRAYEFFLKNYTDRSKYVYAHDESHVVQGADAKWASLADLAKVGMVNNPNERILGALDGEPIFAPPDTTFVKWVGQQGSWKTSCYCFINILHIANTQGRITQDHDHADIGIDGSDSDFEDLELDELDEFALEAEVLNAA